MTNQVEHTLYSFHPELPYIEGYCAVGVYAHGDLEEQLEYDVVGIPFDGDTEDGDFNVTLTNGVYKVNVIGINGSVSAMLFYWQSNAFGRLHHRGLVVLESDEESVKYAQEQFDDKVVSL